MASPKSQDVALSGLTKNWRHAVQIPNARKPEDFRLVAKSSVWWLSGVVKTGWWPCKETPAKRKIFVGWRTFLYGGFLAEKTGWWPCK